MGPWQVLQSNGSGPTGSRRGPRRGRGRKPRTLGNPLPVAPRGTSLPAGPVGSRPLSGPRRHLLLQGHAPCPLLSPKEVWCLVSLLVATDPGLPRSRPAVTLLRVHLTTQRPLHVALLPRDRGSRRSRVGGAPGGVPACTGASSRRRAVGPQRKRRHKAGSAGRTSRESGEERSRSTPRSCASEDVPADSGEPRGTRFRLSVSGRLRAPPWCRPRGRRPEDRSRPAGGGVRGRRAGS